MLATVKALLPHRVRMGIRRLRALKTGKRNSSRSLEDIFSEIYDRKMWGNGDFDSGPGSDDGHHYAEAVRILMLKNDYRSVVDLGCGDFRIGALIARPPVSYVGVDVVPDLISRNQASFGTADISFRQVDMTRGPLPSADVCLVREVFQHLSIPAIRSALEQMRGRFARIIVTDAQPVDIDSFEPNVDHPTSAYTREFLVNSGLRFDRPPFSVPNVEIVCEYRHPTMTHLTLRSFAFSI